MIETSITINYKIDEDSSIKEIETSTTGLVELVKAFPSKDAHDLEYDKLLTLRALIEAVGDKMIKEAKASIASSTRPFFS